MKSDGRMAEWFKAAVLKTADPPDCQHRQPYCLYPYCLDLWKELPGCASRSKPSPPQDEAQERTREKEHSKSEK